MSEEYTIYKFRYGDFARVTKALASLGNKGENTAAMGSVIQEIVSVGTRKTPKELEDLEAGKTVELFAQIMEHNKNFFTKLASTLTAAAEKIAQDA